MENKPGLSFNAILNRKQTVRQFPLTDDEIQVVKGELRHLMSLHKVNAKQVAEILHREHITVRNWRVANNRLCPPVNELRLLRYELEARSAKAALLPVLLAQLENHQAEAFKAGLKRFKEV